MKALIFLVGILAVSSAMSARPSRERKRAEIVDTGEDMDIADVNKDSSHDDILVKPNRLNSAIINEDRLWQSPVPYVLDDSLEMNARGVILRAFEQFRLKTCIDFKPRGSEENYIHVKKLDGCFSYIGQLSGGQDLSIGRFCDEISTVEHEFFHALGFYHEQSRYDRDDYLTIVFENILRGYENNFLKQSPDTTTTNGVKYDYWSVMHYSKNAFTNGNGSTMITKDPEFEDIIGQRLEMSPSDVLELNRHYKCSSTVASSMQCRFSDKDTCQMTHCSDSDISWELVTKAPGGPPVDHTNLPNGKGQGGENLNFGKVPGPGFFMHASTISGYKGNSAVLETKRMSPTRSCSIQCLQFYYFHGGSWSDQLNVWIREFDDEMDITGTRRLVDQITGPRTVFWEIRHVSLNATKHFQVEFEVLKGAETSYGGFSIDDVSLSETQCPDVTMQINRFEQLLTSAARGYTIYSPRQYSSGGYAYSVGLVLYRSYFGLFMQLVSGENDDRLQWPFNHRQVTLQMLDQKLDIKHQMSKQRSFTTDSDVDNDGNYDWGNPREVGSPYVDENNETAYAGRQFGRVRFSNLEEMKYHEFIKGGSAVFVFSVQDITPLLKNGDLPCPEVRPAMIKYPPKSLDKGSCATRILTTTRPPPTTDDSIFGFSPSLAACPVFTLLLALMLLIP